MLSMQEQNKSFESKYPNSSKEESSAIKVELLTSARSNDFWGITFEVKMDQKRLVCALREHVGNNTNSLCCLEGPTELYNFRLQLITPGLIKGVTKNLLGYLEEIAHENRNKTTGHHRHIFCLLILVKILFNMINAFFFEKYFSSFF